MTDKQVQVGPNPGLYIGIGAGIGTAVGITAGVAFDILAFSIAPCAGAGIALGVALWGANKQAGK
ncbi:hypothetical protein CWC22_012485 [Pseudoalteromonas rubra]|uniref:Glycine zipper family protein n=1 Tax=Pseudoalteromonas rubra TaxID=43658 RepID=A0A5S3UZZ0_9GAMM|nr:hypothetical protein [Pseudoalteromonas rubra]QPB83767.1 hypothetical protein CWC22_012485 [Pseudoalteromonas rubra]